MQVYAAYARRPSSGKKLGRELRGEVNKVYGKVSVVVVVVNGSVKCKLVGIES